MNFFEQQERSRFNVKKLIALFFLAVLSMVILTNIVATIALNFDQIQQFINASNSQTKPLSYLIQAIAERFDWHLFFITSLGIIIFITLVGLYKNKQLSRGGKVIAQNLGGRLILSDTKNPQERQLLNIVEEIAIASGSNIPSVYLIEESGINAFAAGINSNDAIIGITRGAIDNLNRYELQGIIAHEFSHIFNGDMKLNIRLIAILHGILVIGLIGESMLRCAYYADDDDDNSINHNRKSSNQKALLGAALIVIGYIGTVLGNLIKAGISRQKEYLADASAVQFTRNPDGIARALKKIGGLNSHISNSKASEISHLFFSQHKKFLTSLMDTHPPLASRILMIDPHWNGEFIEPNQESETVLNSPWKNNSQSKNTKIATAIGAAQMIQNINNAGTIKEKSINKAQELIATLPEIIRDSLRYPDGAIATIYALVIKNNNFYSKQLEILQNNLDANILTLTLKINDAIKTSQELRFTIIEMALPALKQISLLQYQTFKKNILELTRTDSKIDIFEWSLEKILFNNLDFEYNKNYAKPKPIYDLSALKNEASLLLSLIAQAGNKDLDEIKNAFEAAIIDQKLTGFFFIPKKEITAKALNEATTKLEQLKPTEKQKLLKTCVHCISYDGKILPAEAEIFRGFCAILQCPMPLLG